MTKASPNPLTTLLESSAQIPSGGSPAAEVRRAPAHFKTEDSPEALSGIMDIKPSGGLTEPALEKFDPPGAHFAPSQTGEQGIAGDIRTKHGSDDNPPPEGEFLRMFPGARA
jgi:hypothetical protein